MNILVDGQTLESAEVNRGIGVYFKNTLNNMVKQRYEHNWFIMLSRESAVSVLDPWVAGRVAVIIDPIFEPCSNYSRTEAYTNAVKNAVDSHEIDALWIPNPLMTNVLFPDSDLSAHVFLTIHDLIPLVRPIKDWSAETNKEYRRRIEMIGRFSRLTLLCDSDATKQESQEYLGANIYMATVLLGADSKRFLKKRNLGGIKESPSIVFTGGFDSRKNIYGAIAALSEARKRFTEDDLLQNATMKIVCSCDERERVDFYERAEALKIRQQVELTGFVSDKELSEIYSTADLFFFPSLYEGFGLPILEAMLGGAYILSADNSSLPEVCGGHALLCDASDIADMANKLHIALENSAKESAEEKQARQEYALQFSWEKTARQTLEEFEKVKKLPSLEKRLKIAVATPWPDQKTGIANYVFKLMPYWTKYFDVDIFVTDSDDKTPHIENVYGGLYPLSELRIKYSEYDTVLYQIGNNAEFHKNIYEMFCEFPGIAEIHDLVLHPFFYHSYFLQKDFASYKKALEIGYGHEGLEHFEQVKNKCTNPDETRFPMSKTIIKQAKATIFHNHWSQDRADTNGVYVIPHACFDTEVVAQNDKTTLNESLRGRIHLQDGETLIGCFGFVNANKRPEKVMQALKNILTSGVTARLTFFGEQKNSEIDHMAEQYEVSEYVTVTGYLDKAEYGMALELCDIVVNLRYPSMGEASGTLCEAFKYGKPVVVTGINQYLEYPDEVCWKVGVGKEEVPLLAAYLKKLVANKELRTALGENAKAYADNVLTPDKIARMYLEVFSYAENDKLRGAAR